MTPDFRETTERVLNGYFVLSWPEFLAVCDLLKVPVDRRGTAGTAGRTRAVVIHLPMPDGPVTVTREDYGAGDEPGEKAVYKIAQAWDGFRLYHDPVFQAFARRLGVPLELDTLAMTIGAAEDEMPRVTQVYRPREPRAERGQPPVIVGPPPGATVVVCPPPEETTSVHNKKYRTFRPAGRPPEYR
jgi:hypothetical protein